MMAAPKGGMADPLDSVPARKRTVTYMLTHYMHKHSNLHVNSVYA